MRNDEIFHKWEKFSRTLHQKNIFKEWSFQKATFLNFYYLTWQMQVGSYEIYMLHKSGPQLFVQWPFKIWQRWMDLWYLHKRTNNSVPIITWTKLCAWQSILTIDHCLPRLSHDLPPWRHLMFCLTTTTGKAEIVVVKRDNYVSTSIKVCHDFWPYSEGFIMVVSRGLPVL